MENHTWDEINQLVQFGNILDSKIPLIACKLDSAYYLPSIVWFLILGNKFPMLLIGQTKTLAWFWTFRLKFRCVKLIRHWSNFASPWNSFTQFSELFSNCRACGPVILLYYICSLESQDSRENKYHCFPM